MAVQDAKVANWSEVNPKFFAQGLYEASNTQKHPLGTVRELSDGRVFVYAQLAANTNVGVLCQGAAHDVANHGNIAVANNANVGSRIANVTLSDLLATANMYAEGYLHINTPVANGGGFAYKIKNHPAAAANAALSLQLYDAIRANIHSAASKATLCKHPCKDVIIHPSPPTQSLVGVTTANITANQYCWLQKKGPGVVLANGTLVAGDRVYASPAIDGAVSPTSTNEVTDALEQYVGSVLTVNANAHYALVDLNIP